MRGRCEKTSLVLPMLSVPTNYIGLQIRKDDRMKFAAFLPVIVAAAVFTYGAEWYESLPPGVTRTEILKIAGPPSSTQSEARSYYDNEQKMEIRYPVQSDRYDLKEGYLKFVYDKDVLINGSNYGYRDQHKKTFYFYGRDILSSSDQIQALRAYLNAGQYTLLPPFRFRNIIRTDKYPGKECYPIDNAYLFIEPILQLIGEVGFFADKTAAVMLLDDKGNETVLYRAIDNWKNLRPPQVDDEKLKERTQLMEALEKRPDHNFNLVDILGPPDSRMGSGMPYVVYYLKNGLVIGLDMNGQMKRITVHRPGE